MSVPVLREQRPTETLHQLAGSHPDGVPAGETDLDRAARVFLAERTRLFRIAYRVIGNVAGAEDVVQETWLRWQRTNRHEVLNLPAFLTTAATRLAINVIQSASHRHELPTGSPLADLADPSQDATSRVEGAAAIEETLGVLMARLTQPELAAFLLRKGFDYPYREIAQILRTSTPNARQLVRRAQGGITRDGTRRVDPDTHRRLVEAFLAAARTGDVWNLEDLLTDEVGRSPRCLASARMARVSGGAARARAESAEPTRMPGAA
jgi:RNA polymerase sigma factor (sigma-70 family)